MKINKKLFVLVEGNDDERILEVVLKKCFKIELMFYKYASVKKDKIKTYVNNLNRNNDQYLMFADIDESPSVCDSRYSKIQKFGVKQENVVIVKSEIESWYAAGSEPQNFNPQDYESEQINKEIFVSLMKSPSSTLAMIKILRKFNVVKARRKSKSFEYFYTKTKNMLV